MRKTKTTKKTEIIMNKKKRLQPLLSSWAVKRKTDKCKTNKKKKQQHWKNTKKKRQQKVNKQIKTKTQTQNCQMYAKLSALNPSVA